MDYLRFPIDTVMLLSNVTSAKLCFTDWIKLLISQEPIFTILLTVLRLALVTYSIGYSLVSNAFLMLRLSSAQ